ncbi:MAG: MCE family protein [Pirellulales bacterium]|nr:MCE family protein [Pirellulales bacterium]
MDENAIKRRVGVMVLSTFLIAAILILLLGNRPTLFQRTYTLYIDFADAPSVTKNTPVRKSGILIGRVTDVKLLSEGGVRVTAGIHEGVRLAKNEKCEVQSTLLGDAEIRFKLPPGKQASEASIQPGSAIRGDMAADPIQVVGELQHSLSGAINSVSDTSRDLGEVVRKVGTMLDKNERQITEIIDEANATLKMVRNTVEFTNDLLDDPEYRDQLKEQVRQVPRMFEDARNTIADLRQTMESMNRTMGLVDDNLENVKRFTEPLGDNGVKMVEQMNESIARLNSVMGRLDTFTASVENNQGSLGKLLNDEELYNNLSRTARRMDDLSSRLRPIVDDVRIISDKLARHPGAVLRDAVQPGAGTKGVPPTGWR